MTTSDEQVELPLAPADRWLRPYFDDPHAHAMPKQQSSDIDPRPTPTLQEALEAASQAHRDTTRLIRMLTVLAEAGDVDDVLDRTLFSLSDLFEADAVVVLTPAGGRRLALLAECGLGEDLAEALGIWPTSDSVDAVLRALGPAATTGADLPAELGELDIRQVLWLPAGTAEESILLGLFRCSEQAFDPSAIEVLRTLAQRLAVALERAQHHARIERLSRLGHSASADLDPETVIRAAVAALPEIFTADAATVAMLDDEGQVCFPADYGLDFVQGVRRPAEELLAWQAVCRGEPFLLRSAEPGVAETWPAAWRLSSILGVPLHGKESLLGALYLVRSSGQPFSTAARDALMLFSGQLGAAVENARLYAALRESQEQLKLITDSISDMVSVIDGDGTCLYASPSHLRELGMDPARMVGQRADEQVHPDDLPRVAAAMASDLQTLGYVPPVEYRCRTATGSWAWVEARGTLLRTGAAGDDPAGTRLIFSSRVIADRKELEGQLRHAATTDELTGLPNRRRLLELLREALAAPHGADGRPERLALLFVDLDRFKSVNDSLGHAAGDQLLVEVAARLRAFLRDAGRPDDVLARLGGDEFVLLLRDLPDDAEPVVDRLADRTLSTLAVPVQLDGRSFEVTASIGIVLPEPGGTASEHEVLRSADAAMYQAKANGRARWTTYDADLDRALRQRLQLESNLRDAIERQQFEVHYQPVVDVAGNLFGVEALARWPHPVRGMVPPLEFIPVAEDLGLIGALGSAVLRTACRQAATWNTQRRERGLEPLTLAVNISPAQIDDGLDDEVLAVLADTGLEPDRLLLEVTESDYMTQDGSAPQVLLGLRAVGVRIAIDDFGTGFSSFDRLRRFPVDVLKIDRSFVTALDGGCAAIAIISAMLSLAAALGSYVVAEGVELPEQASALHEAGCRHFQGWLYAPARPAAELEAQVLADPVLADPVADERAPAGQPAGHPSLPRARRAEPVAATP